MVRDTKVHEEVIGEVMKFASSTGFSLLHLDYSPIKGPEGNIEYLLHLKNRENAHDIDAKCIPDVVRASHDALAHR